LKEEVWALCFSSYFLGGGRACIALKISCSFGKDNKWSIVYYHSLS
jgi:hypothetical protein